jgi:hypothetical protein
LLFRGGEQQIGQQRPSKAPRIWRRCQADTGLSPGQLDQARSASPCAAETSFRDARRLVRTERITLLGAALTGLGTETCRQSPRPWLQRRHHRSRYRASRTESPDNASGDRYLGSRYRNLKTETGTKLWLPPFLISVSGLEDGAPGLEFMAPGLRSSDREKGRRPATLSRGSQTRRRDPGATTRHPPAKGQGPGIAVGVGGLGVSVPRL